MDTVAAFLHAFIQFLVSLLTLIVNFITSALTLLLQFVRQITGIAG